MRILRYLFLITLLVECVCVHSQPQVSLLESLQKIEIPLAEAYLPPPPDTLSMAFSYDVYRYFYGKTLRDTPRGQQAYDDVDYGINAMCQRMSALLGFELSPENTPETHNLMLSALQIIGANCASAKYQFNRVRPFVRFNEKPYTSEKISSLSKAPSYPSSHSMYAWATAHLLAEVLPQYSDMLLQSAYDYGESRIILGVHWQSDVNAARLLVDACFARLHAQPIYLEQIAKAQAECQSILCEKRNKSLAATDSLSIITFLPEMPDSTGGLWASDLTTYFKHKEDRTEQRDDVARTDAGASVQDLCQNFSKYIEIDISPEATPYICNLLNDLHAAVVRNAELAKETNWRRRPFDRLTDPLITGEDRDSLLQSSSFPSTHAALGWATALTLISINPNKQNELLSRAIDYGLSRVVAGTAWPSDVYAGQLMGGSTFAALMGSADFMEALRQAQQEYYSISGVSQVPITTDVQSDKFTIDGRRATPDTKGIIVSAQGKWLIP